MNSCDVLMDLPLWVVMDVTPPQFAVNLTGSGKVFLLFTYKMYLQIFFNKYCATKLDFYFKFGTLG
jgi:hypothetical protein